MPIGTVPLPYNPWLALALPFVLAAWLIVPVVAAGHIPWLAPLVFWLVLALPLSVPVLQWLLFAFRLHLVQALLPPIAMLMLAAAVATGQEPRWMALGPALFFSTHLMGAVAGRLLLMRIGRQNRAVDDAAAGVGSLPPLLLDTRTGVPDPQQLMARLGLAELVVTAARTGPVRLLRLPASALGEWASQAARAGCFRIGEDREGTVVLTVPMDGIPAGLVRIGPDEGSWLERRLLGRFDGVRAHGAGAHARYLIGTAAPFAWEPTFPLFAAGYFNVGQRADNAVGFVRTRRRVVGNGGRDRLGLVARVADALRTPGEPAPPFADAAQVRAQAAASLHRVIAADLARLDRLIADPIVDRLETFPGLAAAPEHLAPYAAALVDALARAQAAAPTVTDQLVERGVISLARALANVPLPALREVTARLLPLLADPVMAGGKGWRYMPPGTSVTYRGGGTWAKSADGQVVKLSGFADFSGFRLLPLAEALYERLGELGEPARPVIEAVIDRYGPIPPLMEARSRLG